MAYTMTEADKSVMGGKRLAPIYKQKTSGINPVMSSFDLSLDNNNVYKQKSTTGFPSQTNNSPVMAVGQSYAQTMGMPAPSQTTQATAEDPSVVEARRIKDEQIARANSDYETQNKLVEDQKAQIIAQLKAILESRKADINNRISGARDKFQPQRENVDVRRAQDLQRAREMLAAQGVMGGDNLTAQMGINTQASSNISGIDQTQNDYVRNLESESQQLQYTNDADQLNEISKAMEIQRGLLSNKSLALSNAENSYVSNIQAALKSKKEQEAKDKELGIKSDEFALDKKYKEGLLANDSAKTMAASDKNIMDYLSNTNTEETKRLAEKLKYYNENKVNSAKNTGYWNPLSQEEVNLSDQYYDELSPYSNNYADFANKTDNPELARAAQIMSIRKMFAPGNEGLLNQYGQQYRTTDAQKNDAQIAKDNIDSMIKSIEFKYLEPKLQSELMTAQETLNNKIITNQFLPQKLVAEINRTITAAQTDMMNAESSRMNANTNSFRAQDSSNRGWASLNQRQSKIDDKDIDETLKNIEGDYRNELGEKDSRGIKNNQYLNTEGSAPRKELFNRMATSLMDTDIPDNAKTKKLLDRGFTKWEIQNWLPNN